MSTVTLSSLLASASAGLLGRVPCHPLDTAKARLQAEQPSSSNAPRYRNVVQTLLKTFKNEGVRGLYRGFGITALGSAPANCLYLTSYDQASQYLTSASAFLGRNDLVAHFLAGMFAEAFSCVLWVPIDVVKERLQIQEKGGLGNYRGSTNALITIFRTEGFSGIYRGYAATLASFGPYSAFYFAFYEKIKAFTLGFNSYQGTRSNSKNPANEASFFLHLANAALASAMASLVTNPLDLVKLRLQVQRGTAVQSAGAYSGVVDGLVKIMRTDGLRGLYRGAAARMIFHGPNTAITFAAYETFKGTWSDLLDEADEW